MLVKILGIFDIFVAICFWIFGILHIFPEKFILVLGIALLVKGLIFIVGFSVISILDIIFGLIIIIATSVNLSQILIIVIAIFLLQKGILSLL